MSNVGCPRGDLGKGLIFEQSFPLVFPEVVRATNGSKGASKDSENASPAMLMQGVSFQTAGWPRRLPPLVSGGSNFLGMVIAIIYS